MGGFSWKYEEMVVWLLWKITFFLGKYRSNHPFMEIYGPCSCVFHSHLSKLERLHVATEPWNHGEWGEESQYSRTFQVSMVSEFL